MAGGSFGQALGLLIRQKRKAAGLTQTQLAEDAFGDGGKTRRISELENGTVANPHPKTIDPIIVALKITDAELEKCAKCSTPRRDTDLDRAYREARNLIDALARQFEHARPDATLAELDEFLRSKAKEWSELRTRMLAIDQSDKELSELMAKAADAFARGEFSSAEQVLIEAEERFQQSKTLQEVRKHAELRITRGDAKLFQGDANGALELYRGAAEFFRALDQSAMELVLNTLSERTYELSRRSLEPSHFVALGLLDVLTTIPAVQADAHKRSGVAYRKSLILRNMAEQSSDDASRDALERAIPCARDALTDQDDATADTSIQVRLSLANCLSQLGKAQRDKGKIQEAVTILREIKVLLEARTKPAELLDHASNNLGAALLKLAAVDESTSSDQLHDEALEAFTTAARASEDLSNLEVWAAAKINAGSLLAERARSGSVTDGDRIFLRVRAVSEFASACEGYPYLAFHDQQAFAQYQLGEVLFELAKSAPGDIAEAYLSRSMDAFQAASVVWNEEREPEKWATIQLRLGRGFLLHASVDGVETVEHDNAEALKHLNSALPILERLGKLKDVAACKRAIGLAEAALSR